MRRKFIQLVSIVLFSCSMDSAQANGENYPNAELIKTDRQFFIENKGQWHSDVLYLCRMGGLDAWITRQGVNYTFYKMEKNPNASKRDEEHLTNGKFDHHPEDYMLLGHRVIADYVGSNAHPTPEGKQKQEGYYNYLIGNDPSKHASYVGLYKEAIVKNVYNGINIRYYFDKGSLRYDYVVQPGADPTQIKLKLRGQYDTYLKGKDLVYTTRFGEVQLSDLHTYQQGKTITSRFVKQGEVWQIAVGEYDKTQALIIDPLIYSTYIGGNANEGGLSIALDGSGNAFITGNTSSSDYDVTTGTFQMTIGGSYDVFVTKLNATGTGLVYSTYIGGSLNDYGYGIALDGSGNAYITGYTASNNYNVTSGAFQITNGGNADGFVTKLNATGTGLLYSTYIGGSGNETGYSIALDGSGNAYVTGSTASSNYDVTSGAFQMTNGGNADGFVTKLNATGTALLYSTYIGGSNAEVGRYIALDGSGNAYITGYTASNDYDVTSGAFQTTFGGGNDVFVTKLNATGTGLLYSTYIGGIGSDNGVGIALDGGGNAYVTGSTSSGDYDVTTGAFQTTIGGSIDVFVTKLDLSGNLTTIDETFFLKGFAIYPNPSQGKFTLQTEKSGLFKLIDINGKIINTYQVNTKTFIINEQLPAGIYFLIEKESNSVHKLVIE